MEDKKVDFNETVDSSELLEKTLGLVCPVCGLEVTGGFNCCPNDGTKLIADPGSDSALSDRYDSLELIGEGGMSAIYRARHKLMKRTVAIKLLHSHFHNKPDTLRRFQKEAEAISSMSHENVVHVFDFGQLQHGQPYMVMSYISGKSLSETIKEEGPLELKRCLTLFIQIGNGLEHAHKKRIVHRDLKPTNVMLSRDDTGQEQAVIVDFGIAKFMSEGEKTVADLTRTGAVIGSPHYMSPEQCLGQNIDVPSDIYSFGCLMYEALCGKPMFAGGSALETMHKHVNEKPPLLPVINGNAALKAHMQAVIYHAVEKEPGRRYQTAADLVQDLRLIEDALQNGKIPRLAALKACSSGKIRRLSLAAVAISVLLCAGQAGYWLTQTPPWEKRSAKEQHKDSSGETQDRAAAVDDAGITEFVRKNPAARELTTAGISGKGMPVIARLANLEKLSLLGCTADDTAVSALNGLTKLEDLTLKGSKIDDGGLEQIARISSLKRLTVEGKSLSDRGLACLARLKNLESLTVQNIKLSGEGVRPLAQLPHLSRLCLAADSASEIKNSALKTISESLPDLTALKLESTQLTDEGLACLSNFRKLSRLSLSFSPRITDKGLKYVAGLKNLKWLNLNGTEVTDQGLKTLSSLQGLEQIFFWHTRVTDAGMEQLNKIRSLKVLHLTHTAVSDAGLARLLGLEKLIDLKVRDTKITDDGLKLLKNFKHLERLSLQDLPITDEGLSALGDLPALSELDLSATVITDAGLKQLAAMKSLRQLYLKDCRSTTTAALEALKKAMPACRVHTRHFMPTRATD
jgi:eukaryotic-like serine/threonine-protein kinase